MWNVLFEMCVYSILLVILSLALTFWYIVQRHSDNLVWITCPNTFWGHYCIYDGDMKMRCIVGIAQNTHTESKLLTKDSYNIIGCPKECLFNELVKCNKADGNMLCTSVISSIIFIIAIHLWHISIRMYNMVLIALSFHTASPSSVWSLFDAFICPTLQLNSPYLF